MLVCTRLSGFLQDVLSQFVSASLKKFPIQLTRALHSTNLLLISERLTPKQDVSDTIVIVA
jgi:hypothetical protein